MPPSLDQPAGPKPETYPFTVLRARLRARPDAMDFAIGRPLSEPHPEALALLRAEPESALRPARRDEIDDFREAGAELLAREYGARVPAERIAPAPGGRSAIAGIADALLSPGDTALLVEPAYPTFARVASRRGVRVVRCWQDADRAFEPDLRPVADEAASARLAALNLPNNPTGALPTPATVGAITGAIGPDATVFNDATYAPLAFEAEGSSLLGAELGAAVRRPVVELHSLSKPFAMTGLPLSFVAGEAGAIDAVRALGDFAWTPPSAAQMRIGALCLRDGDRLGAIRAACRERVERLSAVLEGVGLRPYPTRAGIYVLCPTPKSVAGRPVAGAWEAAEALLEAHALAVAPWASPSGGFIRFAASCDPADLDRLAGLGRLADD